MDFYHKGEGRNLTVELLRAILQVPKSKKIGHF